MSVKVRNSQRAADKSVKPGEVEPAKKTATIVPQAVARFIEQESLENTIFQTGPIEWSSKPPLVLTTTLSDEGYSVTYSLPGIFGTLFELADLRATDKKLYYGKTFEKTQSKMSTLKIEIELLRSLKHDNLMQLLKIYDNPEKLTIVTHSYEEDLLSVATDMHFGESDVGYMVYQMAQLTQYLNRHDITNIPLRPENFFFSNKAKKRIVLVDINNVILLKHERVAPPFEYDCSIFVAPEIRAMEVFNQTADMWTLGVTMVHLLSGGPNFEYNSKTGTSELTKHWSKVSEEGKRLALSLLQSKAKRMNCATLLQDTTWLKKRLVTVQLATKKSKSEPKIQNLTEAQEGLKEYRAKLDDSQERFPYHRASLFFSYAGCYIREIFTAFEGYRALNRAKQKKEEAINLKLSTMSVQSSGDPSDLDHVRKIKLPPLSNLTRFQSEEIMLQLMEEKKTLDEVVDSPQALAMSEKDFSIVYVFCHRELLEEFLEFIERRLICRENFDFWFGCVEFRKCLDYDARLHKFKQLAHRYIGAEADHEVNLPRSLLIPICDIIQKGIVGDIHMLDAVRSHCWGMLAFDSFTKFIESADFIAKYFIHDLTERTASVKPDATNPSTVVL